MEEDIKILEEKIERMKNGISIYIANQYYDLANTMKKEIKALENLLKERQSDKAKIMHYEKLITNGLASKEITRLNEELLAEVKTNYIPKSLIKEKIEELNKAIEEVEQNIKNTTDEEKRYWKKEKHDLIMQRYILQELLESERGIRIN